MNFLRTVDLTVCIQCYCALTVAFRRSRIVRIYPNRRHSILLGNYRSLNLRLHISIYSWCVCNKYVKSVTKGTASQQSMLTPPETCLCPISDLHFFPNILTIFSRTFHVSGLWISSILRYFYYCFNYIHQCCNFSVVMLWFCETPIYMWFNN